MSEENIKTNELPLVENPYTPKAMPLSVVPPMVTIDVDSSLQEISEIPENESRQSIHNLNSAYLGENREEDEYLKINKTEKIDFEELARLEQEYKPNIDFEVSHFQDKRPISKQLSDQNDEKLLSTINREVRRALDSEQLLAEAIDLEDKEREIADAQLLADIKKEAATRANVDAQLANTLAQYKYDMSQHVTTRELDVNGDARVNIEVVDGDKHGGNLQVETTLVVGSNTEENGNTTAEGNIIGDAHIFHDLYVEGKSFLHDVDLNGDLHVKGTLEVDKATLLNDKLNVEKEVTLSDTLTVEKPTSLKDTLTVSKATTLKDALTAEKYASIQGNLTVGTATKDASETVYGTLNVTKDATFNSNLSVEENFTVEHTATLKDTVLVNDDTGNQKEFSDIIGTIKNALVKDFTQAYDSATGKLTSTLEFLNTWKNDTDRPTVSTITKTIDLDLEKYIIDINDVYAKKTVSNGKTTYTDQTNLTQEQLEAIEAPDYNGDIVRCLKVKYSSYKNATASEGGASGDKAGTEGNYVYFEVNDIFKSINSKHNTDISNVTNFATISDSEQSKTFIDYIEQSENGIVPHHKSFVDTVQKSSKDSDVPTAKAIYNKISGLFCSIDDTDTTDIKSIGLLSNISDSNDKITTGTKTLKVRKTAPTADLTAGSNDTVMTEKAFLSWLNSHIKTVTLKDAAGQTLMTFTCFAPSATAYTADLTSPITLKTITVQ